MKVGIFNDVNLKQGQLLAEPGKKVSLHVLFASLLNHFNGILQIQPQETRGNKQLNLFSCLFDKSILFKSL